MPLSIKRIRGSQSHADLRTAAPRKEISLPVTLISTTNMLSYEAPDLATARQMAAARKSSEEPSRSPASLSDVPGLTPDTSAGSSPSVEYNHLSAYFPGPTARRSSSARRTQAADATAPAIPQRVASHSKRAHETLARKRSLRESGKVSPISSPSSPTLTATDSPSQRTSLELMGVNAADPPPLKPLAPGRLRSPTANSNPFSPELEKLSEVAEDFKTLAEETIEEIEDEDTAYMRKLGLVKFAAVDYRSDVGSCYPKPPFNAGFNFQDATNAWI